ncbi:hypothetical protein AB0I89_24305 [Micromonospora sp. NPDC049801]|uniref:hypothetical protein n=1 Tax=unclassified Micromonospora TaxID=2617518 RepID=UPI0033E73627
MIADVAMKPEHERALAEAATEYEQAAEAKERASAKLADAMRAAYADGEQQSAILRASKHVWSREYMRILLGLSRRKSGDQSSS